jgi:hypothetical protein
MYRDSFRGVCLVSLGRLRPSGRFDAARTAFQQAVLLFRGRPRAPEGSPARAALAGLVQSGSAPPSWMRRWHSSRAATYLTSWLWCCQPRFTPSWPARPPSWDARISREPSPRARDAGLLEAKESRIPPEAARYGCGGALPSTSGFRAM